MCKKGSHYIHTFATIQHICFCFTKLLSQHKKNTSSYFLTQHPHMVYKLTNNVNNFSQNNENQIRPRVCPLWPPQHNPNSLLNSLSCVPIVITTTQTKFVRPLRPPQRKPNSLSCVSLAVTITQIKFVLVCVSPEATITQTKFVLVCVPCHHHNTNQIRSRVCPLRPPYR